MTPEFLIFERCNRFAVPDVKTDPNVFASLEEAFFCEFGEGIAVVGKYLAFLDWLGVFPFPLIKSVVRN